MMDFHQKAAVGLSLTLLLSVWLMISVIVMHCVLRGMIVALILTCSVMYSHVCHVSYTYIAMIYWSLNYVSFALLQCVKRAQPISVVTKYILLVLLVSVIMDSYSKINHCLL